MQDRGQDMAEPLPGLAHRDELRAIYAQKAKTYDERTVSANSKEALDLKVAGEKADGWEVLRPNKRSVRIKKKKPDDRQLEDDVWCALYKMGFKELNIDRNFTLQFSSKTRPRQLDVFAKDDQTVFIVECTQSRDSGHKSVKSLLDKIGSIRADVVNAVHRHYGRDPALKVKFAIATRNIGWRSADKANCERTGIVIITEADIDYFDKLAGFLKFAARYQFLGRYLEGERVEGLRTYVPATKGRMGGQVFYNFLISPHDLLKVAYISHKAKTSNDDLATYQRMVKPARLKAIGRYIDEGGKFPTNIVINLKSANPLRFDIGQNFGDTATGTLHLPGLYGSALVIDGQHRLYGYAHAERSEETDRSVLSVLAYENLPLNQEVKLFVDINTEQVKVQRNLVNEIISTLNIEDKEPKKRLDALYAHIVMLYARIVIKLDEFQPVRGRILTVAEDKTHTRCLTLTSFADGLSENNFLGTIHRANRKDLGSVDPGPLANLSDDRNKTIDKAVTTISKYLSLFAEPLQDHWDLGDDKGGYLCTNLGIRALLLLLRKVIAFVETKNAVRAVSMSPDDIIDYVAPYIKHVVTWFKNASTNDIGAYRNRGSSLLSVSQNCSHLMAIVHDADAEFTTKELTDFISSQDVEGTKQAKDLLDDINAIVYDDVVAKLKAKHGTVRDAWWMRGVPPKIRGDCDERFNNSDGERDRHQFLTFANYATIVQHGDNWDQFKDYYSFPEKDKRKKADQVAWLQRLILIRNITHHVEKGPLSKEQVAYVRQIHRLVLWFRLCRLRNRRCGLRYRSPGSRKSAESCPRR
jgi:DNA sulfur modification protein DndB